MTLLALALMMAMQAAPATNPKPSVPLRTALALAYEEKMFKECHDADWPDTYICGLAARSLLREMDKAEGLITVDDGKPMPLGGGMQAEKTVYPADEAYAKCWRGAFLHYPAKSEYGPDRLWTCMTDDPAHDNDPQPWHVMGWAYFHKRFVEPAVQEERSIEHGCIAPVEPGDLKMVCGTVYKVWTCADKRRVLMKTEAGERFCILFPRDNQ